MAVPATVSIGLARHANETTTLAALPGQADRALYAAKSLGRNRVEDADDRLDPSAVRAA